MILTFILLNSIAWIIVHLSIATVCVHLPRRVFSCDSGLWRVFPKEVAWYRDVLHIRAWKRRLPEGAAWVGGKYSGKLPVSRNTAYLQQLALDTRRGEAAHWLMFICCPLFFLWNPPAVWPILVFYALFANVPCIATQRYNRFSAQRILKRHANKIA